MPEQPCKGTEETGDSAFLFHLLQLLVGRRLLLPQAAQTLVPALYRVIQALFLAIDNGGGI